MEPVAHRWEWRAFSPRFPGLELKIGGLTPVSGPDLTEETYFLVPGEVNAKLRFGLLDVKRLIQVGDDGLQLWAPILKAELPVPAATLREVFDAMGLAAPATTRESYTREQLIDEMLDPVSDITVVPVTKSRVRYLIDGCMAEMARLSAGDRTTTTFAIESEDAAAVFALVTRLGLGGYTNTSYPDGLRSLVMGTPRRHAVIDIGTNSVKFHIGEQHPDGSWARVVDRAELTRLGEGLNDTGEIQPEPLERTIRAVVAMVAEARRSDVLAVAVVGTAVFRLAGNSSFAVSSLEGRARVPVEVIPGEEESRLAFLAVTQEVSLGTGTLVAFDTGGGSTEFTFGRGASVVEQFSLPVGSVTYTERFALQGPVGSETITQVRNALAEDLARLDGGDAPDVVVGMGGAVTNLAAVSRSMAVYDPDAIQGAVLEVAEIDRQIALYASMDEGSRRSIVGLQPDRAKVILAGALVVRSILDKLGSESLVVSDRGLRHGLIRERFGNGPQPG